ncbi:MAG TPA: 16S rRNA (cytosine(1402)-N(4))-methyltransferase RsmH [Thermoanaerobaculia bacterium]|nr:16S rRNA (cytosine(1402)-N(4))-methyltransferase RsmH [Thermoanaerobaculia bacterium]
MERSTEEGAIRFGHEPVMVAETTEFLDPGRGGIFVDATVGLGGHALHLVSRYPEVRLFGIDRDAEALAEARLRLEPFADRVVLARGENARLEELLDEAGIDRIAGLYADLGVSSLQLEKAERGFSLQRDGPLDMRMGVGGGGLTARDIVNGYPEAALEQIIRDYGEDQEARRIARALIRERSQVVIETTFQLRDIVHRAKRGDGGKGRRRIDPATKVFQALRIEVNQELQQLETLVRQGLKRLESAGRLVVISYHSLEDRVVKNILRDAERGDVDPVTGRSRSETQVLEVLTKKPVRPSEAEVARNPRARSARLRAARRL